MVRPAMVSSGVITVPWPTPRRVYIRLSSERTLFCDIFSMQHDPLAGRCGFDTFSTLYDRFYLEYVLTQNILQNGSEMNPINWRCGRCRRTSSHVSSYTWFLPFTHSGRCTRCLVR